MVEAYIENFDNENFRHEREGEAALEREGEGVALERVCTTETKTS